MLASELWQGVEAWARGQALLTLPAFHAWLRQQPATSIVTTPLLTYLRCVTRAEWQQVGRRVQLVADPRQQLALPAWALGIEQRCTLIDDLPTVADVRAITAQVEAEEANVPSAFPDVDVVLHG